MGNALEDCKWQVFFNDAPLPASDMLDSQSMVKVKQAKTGDYAFICTSGDKATTLFKVIHVKPPSSKAAKAKAAAQGTANTGANGSATSTELTPDDALEWLQTAIESPPLHTADSQFNPHLEALAKVLDDALKPGTKIDTDKLRTAWGGAVGVSEYQLLAAVLARDKTNLVQSLATYGLDIGKMWMDLFDGFAKKISTLRDQNSAWGSLAEALRQEIDAENEAQKRLVSYMLRNNVSLAPNSSTGGTATATPRKRHGFCNLLFGY
jgi:hypothetical protein